MVTISTRPLPLGSKHTLLTIKFHHSKGLGYHGGPNGPKNAMASGHSDHSHTLTESQFSSSIPYLEGSDQTDDVKKDSVIVVG